jgi:L-ascorbate metabolism protein UlaG (beta-lactamase superfamily)
MAQLRFLGVAGYEIVTKEGQHILVDPFLDSCPGAAVRVGDLERADLICVTHAAPDHYGDTLAIARKFGAKVVCGADVKEHLIASGLPSGQITATCWNIRVRVNGILVHPLECHHWSHTKLPDGRSVSGVPMAFLIHVDEGVRFYQYGDTALFSDLKLQGELYRPTHAAIGVSQPQEILHLFEGPDEVLTGEMDPREAFLAAQWLGARTIFPCHYINPDHKDITRFQDYVREYNKNGDKIDSIVLKPGDWFELIPDLSRIL